MRKNTGALHCTHCTSSMTVVPPVSFLFHIHAHASRAPLEIRLCLTTVIHQSPRRPVNSLICLTIHLCIDSAHLSKHIIDSSVYSLYALIGPTICKNQWSTEEACRRRAGGGCLSSLNLIRYGESAHKNTQWTHLG